MLMLIGISFALFFLRAPVDSNRFREFAGFAIVTVVVGYFYVIVMELLRFVLVRTGRFETELPEAESISRR